MKDTLRNLVVKCPSSQLYTMTRYLKECSLASYCLDTVFKHHILSNEETKLISMLRQPKLIQSKDVAESFVIATAVKKQTVTTKKSKKKKRNRRKTHKEPKTAVSAHKASSIQEESETTALLDQTPQAKSENISLANKQIAKKIIDSKNNMTIYVYRLKDIDPAAGKHINYDNRVQRWFSKPEAALAQKEYAENDPRRAVSIPFHNFAQETDKYALKWGFKSIRDHHGKNETVIELPGIIIKDENTFEGLFVYVIDIKMLCYHRFFHLCDWHKKRAEEWHVDFKE